jgi:hypothetical protein
MIPGMRTALPVSWAILFPGFLIRIQALTTAGTRQRDHAGEGGRVQSARLGNWLTYRFNGPILRSPTYRVI